MVEQLLKALRNPPSWISLFIFYTLFIFFIVQVAIFENEIIDDLIKIKFNNKTNKGNPIYYWADVRKLQQSGFSTIKKLKYEIKEYVDWVISLND